MEHTEAGADNVVVLLEVLVAARLVVPDIAGVQPLLSVWMRDSRIPAIWTAQMEQVGLIAFEDAVNDLGIVVEVGCEPLVEVAHLEQEGQAVPLVGKEDRLDVVVEQLAGVQSAAALSPPAQQLWHFLTQHPPL